MIGSLVTDSKTGKPLEAWVNKLNPSNYQPSEDIKKLFSQCQRDYQTAWMLLNRPFDEFDGVSLLTRAKLDQQTFSAFVGAEWRPKHKAWRWKGRKNTSRNKIIGILAHTLAGMLYPAVSAFNDEDPDEKLTARVMRILVENHLKKAQYEIKYLFMLTSALVNPAVFVEVEYVEAIQRVKQKLSDGSIKVLEAVDEIMSGLNLNILPIDELLLTDYYTFDIQKQPCLIRSRRISYDYARSIHAGRHFNENGVDLFDYVEAGKTRVMPDAQSLTLFDVETSEADSSFVNELTYYYRAEDLEVTFVGGVFMGTQTDVYNSNPFKHRRMTVIDNDWISMPVYPFAKSGFEPLDPSMRFAFYKSAAAKLFWDDATINKMHQLAVDGTNLDIIRPFIITGGTKVDSTVIVPGASIGQPAGATFTPLAMNPNIRAAYDSIGKNEGDESESTQDRIQSGIAQSGVTATAIVQATQNAKIIYGVFGSIISKLVEDIGALFVDCLKQHVLVGEIDATMPEALKIKPKKFSYSGKEGGANVTNIIELSDKTMGQRFTKEELKDLHFDVYEKYKDTSIRRYEINPYMLAKTRFELRVDAEQMVMRSTGAYEQRKALAFQMMTHPAVAPFTDPETVATDFVIDEFSDGDPERYKRKGDLLNSVMMGGEPNVNGTNQNINNLVGAIK